VLSVRELDVVRTLLSCNHVVTRHVRCELMVSPQIVGSSFGVDVEVGDRRMVGCVLTVNLSTIRKLALQGFSKEGVKWFHLRVADVKAAYRISNNQF